MSFGYGVGDCIVVGRLAWKIFESFREAPEIFRNLHNDVLSLHTALERVKQTVCKAALPPASQFELKMALKNCDSILQGLNELTVKYKKVGEKTKSPVDRIRLSNEDIADIRLRLILSIVMLMLFIQTCPAPFQQEQIRLIEANQRGRRGSIASIQTVDSLSREARMAWRGLRKELEGVGITAENLESNHDFIMDVFIRANETGTFEENPPPNAGASDESQVMLAIGPPEAFRKSSPTPEASREPSPTPEASRESSPTPEDRESHTSQVALPTPEVFVGTESTVPSKEKCKNTHAFRTGTWVGVNACGDETCDAHVPMALQHTLRLPAETTAGPLPNAQYYRSSRSRYQHHHIYQLLKQKPRPNISTYLLNTALLDACMYPSTGDMVWTFLQHGATPDALMGPGEGQAPFMFGKVEEFQQETLMWCSALMLAASQGRNDIVRILIDWDADIDYHVNDNHNGTKDRMGWMSTPLGCAVTGGDLATVRTILSAGASVNTVEKWQGTWWSALHEACRASTEDICEELLNWGAEIDLLSKQGTPLMVALYVRKYEIVRLLLKRGANANFTMQKANVHGHKRPLDVAFWVANDSGVYFLDDEIPILYLLRTHGAKMTNDETTNLRNLHERREGWKLDPYDASGSSAYNPRLRRIYYPKSRSQHQTGSSVGAKK